MPTSTHATIKEMADQYNLSFRTLRFYEQRGLLNPFRLGPTRYYTAKDRLRLELIIKGKQLGFTLNEISNIVAFKEPQTSRLEQSLDKDQIIRQIKTLIGKRAGISRALDELRLALATRDPNRSNNGKACD